jgi:uncharacterized membrane protein HdeD (DUF308 family)
MMVSRCLPAYRRLVDGVLAIIVAFRGETPYRLTMALGGVVGVLAGVIAFAYPG